MRAKYGNVGMTITKTTVDMPGLSAPFKQPSGLLHAKPTPIANSNTGKARITSRERDRIESVQPR